MQKPEREGSVWRTANPVYPTVKVLKLISDAKSADTDIEARASRKLTSWSE